MTMMIQPSSSPTNNIAAEAPSAPASPDAAAAASAGATSISSNNNTEKTLLPKDFEPSFYDVICGRGKASFNHAGNVQFRALIEETSEQYAAAEDDKLEKIQIVTLVLNRVQAQGQFVRKDPFSERWYPVADSVSREKISSAFRDHLHEKYRSSAMSKKRRREERVRSTTTPPSASAAAAPATTTSTATSDATAAAVVLPELTSAADTAMSKKRSGNPERYKRARTALAEAALHQHHNPNEKHRRDLETKMAGDQVLARWAEAQKPDKESGSDKEDSAAAKKKAGFTRKILNKDSPLFDKDFCPSDDDVLCGRGPLIANHPGNVKFHNWVKELLPSYFKAAIMEKQDFVHQVLDQVWQSGGRFLKEDQESGCWYQVNDPAAKAKTSQAFRDGLGATKNKLRREEERNKDVQRINFEVKAHQGDPDAQYQLALCYMKGSQGAEKSPRRAVEWLEIAAKKGHADAQYELGKAYHEGVGVPQDMGVAVDWFCKAASQFHRVANQGKAAEASEQAQKSAYVALKASRNAPPAAVAPAAPPSAALAVAAPTAAAATASGFAPVAQVPALAQPVPSAAVAAPVPQQQQPMLALAANPQLVALGPLRQPVAVQVPEPRLTVQEWLALSRQVNFGGGLP